MYTKCCELLHSDKLVCVCCVASRVSSFCKIWILVNHSILLSHFEHFSFVELNEIVIGKSLRNKRIGPTMQPTGLRKCSVMHFSRTVDCIVRLFRLHYSIFTFL